MTLFVHGIRANGNTRGLLVAGFSMRKGEGVLIGATIVHGVGARGNIVVLVPCSRSGTLALCTT